MTAKIAISKCGCCGKPLSDPISVKLGIGPVCRIALKIKDMKNKNQNLFGMTAQYSWGIDGLVLWIKDTGKDCRSVTNDMENVLSEIQADLPEGKLLTDYKIMYLDSLAVWDGVAITRLRERIQHERFAAQRRPMGTSPFVQFTFFSINERSYQAAKDKLLQRVYP
jgi:hypothetical protein